MRQGMTAKCSWCRKYWDKSQLNKPPIDEPLNQSLNGLGSYVDTTKRALAEWLLLMAEGKFTGKDLLDECRKNLGGGKGSFAHLDLDAAARHAERGSHLPLSGIAMAVADNIAVKDMPGEAGSALLAKFIPPYTATAVARLASNGAYVMGKTKVPELGVSEPGVFSDGAVDAVANGYSPAALSIDDDGAPRISARNRSAVAFKPSYGTVSRFGLYTVAPSLETVAFIAGGVRGVSVLFSLAAGPDGNDVSIRPHPLPDVMKNLDKKADSLRVGVLAGDFSSLSLPAGVIDSTRKAAGALSKAGAKVTEISLQTVQYWKAVHSIIYCAEASGQLAKYDGIQFGEQPADVSDWESLYSRSRAAFTQAVKATVLLGTHALSLDGIEVWYNRALRMRTKIMTELAAVWKDTDVLLLPDLDGQALSVGANLTGCPAVSVGWAPIEIWAAPFRDDLALQAARNIEKADFGR